MSYNNQQPYQGQQYPQQGYQQGQQYPQQGYNQPPQHQQPQHQQQQYQQQPYQQAAPTAAPQSSVLQGSADHGSFQGGTYAVTHRDTNAVLTIDLQQQGATIRAKPGAMIHMAGTVALTGKIKFSMRKMITGGEMAESNFAGHGKVALAPTLAGDIVTLQIDGSARWKVGKDAFLACTQHVTKESKMQGLGKAMFSGEDLFVYQIGGQGLLWLTSFGAVDRIDLQSGEQHIVDNGHLVAWNCEYKMERAGGGSLTSMKTGEGLVCRFVGPGSIYIQTRNMDEFASWVRSVAGAQGA